MTTQQDLRASFLSTTQHVKDAFSRVSGNSGPKGVLTAPDVHKISEGLFLSAWTSWEGLLREVFIADLAVDPNGALRKEIKAPRTKKSLVRLAQLVADHPDERGWVEWNDTNRVVARATNMLSAGHRFGALSSFHTDIDRIKRIRNAVAHKSDHAWDSFKRLVKDPAGPFGLLPNQMKAITTGRFLCTRKWGGQFVVVAAVEKLESAANALVP